MFFELPRVKNIEINLQKNLLAPLNISEIEKAWTHAHYLYVLLSESVFNQFKVDHKFIQQLNYDGLVITSACTDGIYDFKSRCFYPKEGIDEDPVTGSAHVSLAEEWSVRLQKMNLLAYQASSLGGELDIRLGQESISIGGFCRLREEKLSIRRS